MKDETKVFLKYIVVLIFVVFLFGFSNGAKAQQSEVTVTLNEQFLNSFLDAVFANLDTPTFQLSKVQALEPEFAKAKNPKSKIQNPKCAESVTLVRELNGVRTAVRFADGKILVPLAFVGRYEIPFVGCTDFRGVGEARVNLEYDREKQILFGRVRVEKVDLNGVPGIASGLVARLVQGTIDKKVNPVEILRAEQLSAIVPVNYANGAIKLKAVDMRPEINGNALNVRIAFEFLKAR